MTARKERPRRYECLPADRLEKARAVANYDDHGIWPMDPALQAHVRRWAAHRDRIRTTLAIGRLLGEIDHETDNTTIVMA